MCVCVCVSVCVGEGGWLLDSVMLPGQVHSGSCVTQMSEESGSMLRD